MEAQPTEEGGVSLEAVYPVREDVLGLRVEAGAVDYGETVPYAPRPGDRVAGGRDRWVKRDGRRIGALVGAAGDRLHEFDRYRGGRLDEAWADRRNSYRLQSPDDPRYQRPRRPEAVARKSKPSDMARTDKWKFEWPLTHRIYLDWPEPLTPGRTYELSFPGSAFAPVTFEFRPDRDRSEAVRVNQLGFRADDPVKVAFLSLWTGTGGPLDYPEGLEFWAIDEATDRRVWQGRATLARRRDEPEDPRDRNYTGTDVYRLDFSTLTEPGRYRICADRVGCSFPFAIGGNPWETAFRAAANGLYVQRSGIALAPPQVPVPRPRPFHPDDGMTVYQSSAQLEDTRMGLGEANPFESLQAGKTDAIVPDAWGGYFDAGDWDRRIQHLEVARRLFELVELFPDYFAAAETGVPQSDPTLPGVVEEALWGIDFFRRLQAPDGGIPGGVESAHHPRFGETSWQESLTVMAYAPDCWSSYSYAAAAAQAATWLAAYPAAGDRRAAPYRDSARRAMTYAEANCPDDLADRPHAVADTRNLAALELYRMTGDRRWHELFLATTALQTPAAEAAEWGSHNQRHAAFIYARLPADRADPAVRDRARAAVLREADRAVDLSQQTAFGWTKLEPYAPIGWGNSLAVPQVATILRAHALSGRDRYLAAAVRASQFALGANPDNLTYTTGLGARSPQNPLAIDWRMLGAPPPTGIAVYGPLDLQRFSDRDVSFFGKATDPPPAQWPTAEAYFDVYLFPPVNEFTVSQTLAPNVYTWGYLAARPAR